MSDFFVNLVSSENLDVFPRNNGIDFTNVPAQKIDLSDGNYEVALAMLIFTSEDDEPVSKANIATDNKINILTPSERKIEFSVSSTLARLLSDESVLNTIRTNIEKITEVSLLTDYDSFGRAKIRLLMDSDHKAIFVIDSLLAQALGFEQNIFRDGEHIAKRTFDPESVEQTVYDTWIKLVTFTPETAEIAQLDDMSVDAIAEAITDAFEHIEKNVLVKSDAHENYLIIKNDEEFMSFTLPITVSRLLSINPQIVFTSGITTVNIQGIKRKSDRGHIICLSDIVEPQYYASEMLPVLRLIPDTPNIKGTVCSHFSPLFYVPVKEKVLQNIRLRFKSASSDDIRIDAKKVTTATLHFRKK